MAKSLNLERMQWCGNFKDGRFRPDERGSCLSTLLLCVGSGSESNSYTEKKVMSMERMGR